MKIRVKQRFHDAYNYAIVYEVGQVVDFMDVQRAKSIVERGLGEIAEEPAKAQPKPEAKPVVEEAEQNESITEVPDSSDSESAETHEEQTNEPEQPKRKANKKKSKR